MSDIWKPAQFQIAMPSGPTTVSGYEHFELGLHLITGRGKKAKWILTHLGTGLRLCEIEGSVAVAFQVATEIAEAGDWGFISMEGYKDRFPDAAQKMAEILNRHTNARRAWVEYDPDEKERIRPIAQQIAASR